MGANLVERQVVLDGQVSGTTGAGTTTRATITEINGTPIGDFDEIHIYLEEDTALTGAGNINIFMERAEADPATVWFRYARFDQLTSSAHQPMEMVLPIINTSGDQSAGRTMEDDNFAVAEGEAVVGFWGDAIRVVEVLSGTVSGAATYTINIMGIIRGGKAGN
jgi:hypothetical protein